MIHLVQHDDKYEVTFKYDPDIIALVKNVPGRRWLPDAKMWTIPSDKLGFLLAQFKGTMYENQVSIQSFEDLNVNATIDVTTDIPNVDVSKIPFYVKPGASPYPHQLDFMRWSIYRQAKGKMSGFLLADDQGLAKTMEVANLAIYNQKQYKYNHCLVICCINSSKYNWKRDIELHTDNKYSPYILGTRLRKDGSEKSDTGSKEKLEDLLAFKKYGQLDSEPLPYFIIMNIEAVRYREGKNYPIANRLIELINEGQINMIAVDEVHKNASPSSLQGKQLLRIKKYSNVRVEWIPMTGTPITKNPTDVFLPLKLIDGHNFSSYYMWCQQFCVYGGYGGHEIVGYKNIPRLKAMLQSNMIRRLKSDVLDLPPKIKYTEYVENTPYQISLAAKVTAELRQDRYEVVESLNPLTRFLRLRQVNGNPELVDSTLSIDDPKYLSKNAKLQRLLELLEEIHERGEKVIIFSNWVESLRTLYRFVSKYYHTCCFTGTMKSEEREKHKRVFQENPKYTVILGTIGALGTTHTLTSARNVIFYDSPWNPSDKEQAEDRAYRIGTTQSVNIYTLVSSGTIDDRVEQILARKDNVSKYIVDGKLDIRSNPALFDFLLGDTNMGGLK